MKTFYWRLAKLSNFVLLWYIMGNPVLFSTTWGRVVTLVQCHIKVTVHTLTWFMSRWLIFTGILGLLTVVCFWICENKQEATKALLQNTNTSQLLVLIRVLTELDSYQSIRHNCFAICKNVILLILCFIQAFLQPGGQLYSTPWETHHLCVFTVVQIFNGL